MALFFSGEVYVFFRFFPTSTCQKCPPSILSQCLLQAGKHLLPKTPLRGSAEKVLPSTASPCVESAVEQAEAAEHWTDSRFWSRADLDELHTHPVRKVWGHQPVLLLTRSCVFSCFSFFPFPSLFLFLLQQRPASIAALSRFEECQQNYQRGRLQPECRGCNFF